MFWRHLYVIFLIYTLIDGFVSNASFPFSIALLYRDILLIVVFVFFVLGQNLRQVMQESMELLRGSVYLAALAFIFASFAQIFNPATPSLFLGILGLRIYFLNWILIFMTFAYVRDIRSARFIIVVIVFTSIFVNAFGLYQFFAGPDFLIQRYPGFRHAFFEAALEATGPIKSFYRIIGTFASTGQYANFLDANIMFCFGLIFSSKTPKGKLCWIFAQILNFLALCAAGSRGALLFAVVTLFIFVVLTRRRHRSSGAAILITLVSLAIGFSFLGEGVRARFKTLTRTKMVQERTFGVTSNMFMNHLNQHPMGLGIGVASTAARHLGGNQGPNSKINIIFVENFPSKLQVELGVGGVLTFFILLFCLIKRWWFEWFLALPPDSLSFAMPINAYAITYFVVLSFFGILDTPPGYMYIMIILGMTLKLVWLKEYDPRAVRGEEDSRESMQPPSSFS